MVRALLILLLVFSIQFTGVVAEPLYIDQSRRLDFVPDEAFFIVEYDERRTVRVAATLLAPSPTGGVDQDYQQAGRWFAGARIEPPSGVARVSYSAIFVSKGNRYEFVPVEHLKLSERPAFRASREALRALIEERKGVLGSWRVQLAAQDESARRLRADAEVIGEFGRIIEKKQEVDQVTQEISNVVRDIDNLERFLKLASNSAQPVNFVAREAQLTRAISQLAAAAKVAEVQELRRRSSSAGDLQRRLALVEATRNDDPSALEAELRQLREQRARRGK